jgi:hypothetical protein
MGLKCGTFPQVIHRSAGPEHCVGALLCGRSVPRVGNGVLNSPKDQEARIAKQRTAPPSTCPERAVGIRLVRKCPIFSACRAAWDGMPLLVHRGAAECASWARTTFRPLMRLLSTTLRAGNTRWMSSALPEGGGRRKAAAPSPMVVKEMRRRVRGIYRSGRADKLRARFRFGQLSGQLSARHESLCRSVPCGQRDSQLVRLHRGGAGSAFQRFRNLSYANPLFGQRLKFAHI